MLMHVRELVLFLSFALSKMSCLLCILNKKSDHYFLNKNIFLFLWRRKLIESIKFCELWYFWVIYHKLFSPVVPISLPLSCWDGFVHFFSHLNFFILPKLLLLIKDLPNIYLQRCWCISHIWLCCLVTIIYFCFLAFSLE